ncbi:MAG: hypothetical protein V4457_04715 [Pseudomonadota bacterium]
MSPNDPESESPFEHTQESYRVLLDGDWGLDDLYEFPHAFNQCYSFIYCLDSELDIHDRERIDGAFAAYPWRGGYSYVNIYFVMQNQIPWRHRPTIKAIQKASPGWLDIFLYADVAIQIAKSVGALAGAGVVAVKSYAAIKKTLSQIAVERERAKLQVFQVSAAKQKTLLSMCDDLAMHLGFKNVKELHQRTGDPEVSLKLLSAHYRRTKILLEFVEEGKASLPERTDG